ncbi:MAG: biopolymer transporter ExbD [Filomicrobium sp.]
MRFKQQPEKKDPGENLIPLINVIFLMLIFFLAASTIRPFSDRQIKLAEAAKAEGAGGGLRMAVIREDGSVYLGGQPADPSALQAQFTAWAADDAKRGVTLVADQGMKAEHLIKIVTQANNAGISNVKLLTRKAR